MPDSSSRKSWVQFTAISMFLIISGGFFVYYSGRYKEVPGCLLFHDTVKCRQREQSIVSPIVVSRISDIVKKYNTSPLRTATRVAHIATKNPRLKLLNKFFKCK